MPADENLKFGIEFETNAGSVAKQIDDLDKSQERLDRNDQKRKKRQKKDRTPQEVAAVYMKMLRKYAKLQQQTDKGKIKDNKTLLDLEKQRFNTVRKMVKLVATTGAVSWFFGKVSEAAQYGKNLNIASLTTGINSSTINALSMLTKKYGGGLESTQGDLRRINDIIWNLTNLGYDSSLDNAMTYFPKELMSMFYKDGQTISDPMQVISNIQEATKGKDASTLQRLSELLGVSNALVLALANNTTSIENSIEAEKQRLAIEQDNVKKLADLQHAMDAFDTTLTNEFASQLSSVLGEDFKSDFQNMAKALAMLATIPMALTQFVKWIGDKTGWIKGLGEALMPFVVPAEQYEAFINQKAEERGLPTFKEAKNLPAYEQKRYLEKVDLGLPQTTGNFQDNIAIAPSYDAGLKIWDFVYGLFKPQPLPLQKTIDEISTWNQTNSPMNSMTNSTSNTINAPITFNVNGNVDEQTRYEIRGDFIQIADEILASNSGGMVN